MIASFKKESVYTDRSLTCNNFDRHTQILEIISGNIDIFSNIKISTFTLPQKNWAFPKPHERLIYILNLKYIYTIM